MKYLGSLLLYTALLGFANISAAQSLSPDQRAELEALREGEMRKLTIHDAPEPIAKGTYSDPDSREYGIANSNGKIRLLNFWATWCAPCRREKPSLDQLQASLGGDAFEVIAIASGRNDMDAIERFNESLGITSLKTHLDPRATLGGELRVLGLPVTVLLNREGQEIGRLIGGADWNSESARAIIDYLVALPAG